ncbi:hypothetical protein LCGC14_2576650 [marine sediment metagenome]|uniref:DNA (cytosine-5-)-methyltransferase n=1 Tax=marine sediment metagenome TaxID=412755 RepID=A0A0F9AFP1_9ZZZZ
MTLTHLSLFSGIGGIDLAAEWAGFKTVLMVENNAYCQKVLRKHWPDVSIIGDIKDVTKETIQEAITNATSQRLQNKTNKQEMEEERGGELQSEQSGDTEAMAFPKGGGQYSQRQTIREGEKCPKPRSPNQYESGRTGDNKSISPITLITGGFPCQPFSVAGKQRGKEDDRYLWPEMLRVISEVRPTWVVAENVAGLLRMGFDDCISDLESAGYETTSFLIPACAVNAPHRRDRVFIVAHSINPGDRTSESGDNGDRAQGNEGIEQHLRVWAVEPELGRVAHGIPKRVDRLRCLGNAVVPQQIYPILKAIAEIELNIPTTKGIECH